MMQSSVRPRARRSAGARALSALLFLGAACAPDAGPTAAPTPADAGDGPGLRPGRGGPPALVAPSVTRPSLQWSVGAPFSAADPSSADGGSPNVVLSFYPPTGPSDVVWQQTGGGNLGVWHMDGSTGLGESVGGWSPFGVSSGWRAVMAADFDGDGGSDLVFNQTGTGNFGVWLMNGAAPRTGPNTWYPFSASVGWEIVGAADFSRDGNVDLLMRNLDSGQNGIAVFNFRTGAYTWSHLPVSAGWHADAAGFFDGSDRYPDVLWHRTGSTDFAIWRMFGASLPTTNAHLYWFPFTASAGWEVVGAASFDGDVRDDLLWYNASTGQSGIWRMSTSGASTDARLGTAASAWTSLAPSVGWRPAAAGEFGGSTGSTVAVLGDGATADHECMVDSRGQLFCWGANTQNQLGDGTTTERVHPVRVSGVAGVTAIARGTAHTCAVASGQGWCWGSDASGQVGLGAASQVAWATPTQLPALPGGATYAAIAAGGAHTCALSSAGAVYCWGSNASGQLGRGSLTPAASRAMTAVALPGGVTGFTAISAGNAYTCALANTGQPYCWGENRYGQVGTVTNTDPLVNSAEPSPVAVAMPAGVSGFDQIAAGWEHACARVSGGSGGVYCWGRNYFGELGQSNGFGAHVVGPTPLAVALPPAVTSVAQIASGASHSCVIANAAGGSGSLYCWGWPGAGQTQGAPSVTGNPSWTPALMSLPSGMTGARVAAPGLSHTCVLGSDYDVACWGDAIATPRRIRRP